VALKLWVERRSRLGLQVRSVSSDWHERTITFRNAPPPGPVAALTGLLQGNAWASVDVSSLVRTDGIVSLALTTESQSSVLAASREAGAALAPRLVVTTEPEPEPDPEPQPLSPFTVTAEGTLYRAESPRGVVYSGTLKSVVESAAANLAAAGGGVVRFGPGTFDLGLDSLRFQALADVAFEGAGMDATEIRNSNNGALDTEIFSFSRARAVEVRDMALSARGAERTTSDAVDFDAGSENAVERVRVSSSRGRGIVFDGKDLSSGVPLDAESNVVRDCVITGTPLDGIQLLAASRNRVERCTITNPGRHGISIVKASSTAAQPNKKPVENVLAANVIHGAGDDGINITSGDRNELLGNIVLNSSSTAELGDGIKIASADGITSDENVVAGNSASDTREVKRQRYGLHIADAACVRTVVRENTLSGNRLGPVHDAGTDTVFTTSADTEPPTTPGGVSATAVEAERVDVTWEGASDDVGVDGYTVYRDGSPVATLAASARRYTDTSVSGATTYSYSVDAFDAAGNHSAESTFASVTTPPGATISTFAAIADAYVNTDLPDTSFGLSETLRTDLDPVVRSYVRFELAGIAGAPTKVTLRIFANSASTGGFDVRSVTGTWDETVTFATSPAPGESIRSSGAFVGGRYTDVDVTAAVAGNGVYDFALVGLDTTAVAYARRETATPPQLVVEWSPGS
jgi:hypothetical protein